MSLIHKNVFDWQEDLDSWDFREAARKSSVRGRHIVINRLSLVGWLRKIFGVKKQ